MMTNCKHLLAFYRLVYYHTHMEAKVNDNTVDT